MQVVDFWLYENPRELAKQQRLLRRICPDGIEISDIDYRFIDGNHENFGILDPDAPEPVQMFDSVTYIPRGSRALLAGAEILFFGGVSSADTAHRTEGKSWWTAENISGAPGCPRRHRCGRRRGHPGHPRLPQSDVRRAVRHRRTCPREDERLLR
ncbi:hypothetical protein [Corynebacterium sp. AOP12-C2-36]|uniref:hypothetical protein n=1 Tax=Corynebacterium sp. AOP12-C2-36 TaxID=3457723 RepID=UPI004033D476